MLEDGVVSLQRMLSSPYLAEHKDEALAWSDNLRQIQQVSLVCELCIYEFFAKYFLIRFNITQIFGRQFSQLSSPFRISHWIFYL